MKLSVAFVGCMLLFSSTVHAQASVPAGQPLTARFMHDGQNTSGYRFVLDGAPLPDLPATVLQGGSVTQTLAALSVGTHTLAACAFNAAGASCTPDLAVNAFGPPNAPTNLTVTLQIAINSDGTVTLIATSAEVTSRP